MWLGRKLHATNVIYGIVDPQSNDISLKISLFKTAPTKNPRLVGSRFETSIPLAQFRNHLEPSKALGNVLAPYRDKDGKRIGIGDSTTSVNAHCSYMPNPPYTEQARAHKISGIILGNATVTKDGRIEDLFLIRGLAYGLDENALKTVSTWRCSPAMLDGKPCPIRVQFEVSFKLY